MRSLFIVLVITLLTVPALGMGVATDSTVNEIGFAGFAYDNGPYGAAGLGKRIIGSAWGFIGTELGVDQHVILEVAWMFQLKGISTKVGIPYLDRVTVGIVGGPDANWENAAENDGIPTVARIVGSAGAILNVDINPNIGIWGFYKHKFGTNEIVEKTFINSNVLAVGVSFNANVLSGIF